jgi:hypothetical protein
MAVHTQCHERSGTGPDTADGECHDTATGIRELPRYVYLVLTTNQGSGIRLTKI